MSREKDVSEISYLGEALIYAFKKLDESAEIRERMVGIYSEAITWVQREFSRATESEDADFIAAANLLQLEQDLTSTKEVLEGSQNRFEKQTFEKK